MQKSELAERQKKIAKCALDADHLTLLRLEKALESKEIINRPSEKALESKKRVRQEYSYSYRPAQDVLTETTIGKNVKHAHLSKDECLEITREVLVPLINSKGVFQADEHHYEKSLYSVNRIRTVLRICVQLGVMKRTYISGRLYSADGGSSGFLSVLERAWKEKVHTL